MDIFVEQIVKKPVAGKDLALKILIGAGTAVLAAACIFVFLFIIPFAGLGLLILFGICYGGYVLLTNLDCEYEYIVTNGDIDVDKIIAKRKRVRLITAKAPAFEAFGEYTDSVPPAAEGATVVNAVGLNESEADTKTYYADFKHAAAGEVRLIFTPEQKVVEAIMPFLPATVRINLKKQQ